MPRPKPSSSPCQAHPSCKREATRRTPADFPGMKVPRGIRVCTMHYHRGYRNGWQTLESGTRALSTAEIQEAKGMHDEGWTQQEIADHFQVGRSTISAALRHEPARTKE